MDTKTTINTTNIDIKITLANEEIESLAKYVRTTDKKTTSEDKAKLAIQNTIVKLISRDKINDEHMKINDEIEQKTKLIIESTRSKISVS